MIDDKQTDAVHALHFTH